ncbi:MAG TPA: hypothetical protein VNM69_21815 [Bacillus sp. (in: firmicutes)]|nr:hypothetical protein [Bacillus sp. (in: firmicutes)]
MEEFIDSLTGEEIKIKSEGETLLGLARKEVRLANFSEPLEGMDGNEGFQPQNNQPFSRVVVILQF